VNSGLQVGTQDGQSASVWHATIAGEAESQAMDAGRAVQAKPIDLVPASAHGDASAQIDPLGQSSGPSQATKAQPPVEAHGSSGHFGLRSGSAHWGAGACMAEDKESSHTLGFEHVVRAQATTPARGSPHAAAPNSAVSRSQSLSSTTTFP